MPAVQFITLIAIARLFANHCERQFAARPGEAGRPPLRDTLNLVLQHAARGPQRERPGRQVPRQSRRPSKKWRNRKPAEPQTAA